MKEGWEYKKLGEIATDMYRGSGIKREQVTSEGIQCVRYGEIYTTYHIAFNNCVSRTKEELISSKKYFEHGDILFAITGESVEEIGMSIAYLGNDRCLAGGDIVVMKHEQNPKYLSYALLSPSSIKQKGFGKVKLKVVHTNIPSLKEVTIPVPPLSEQQAIVDYLDSSFAKIDAMKANAEKSLNEAKALFQSSLQQLLEPKEGWEEKALGEVGSFIRGGNFSKKDFVEDGFPCIHYGQIHMKFGVTTYQHLSSVPQSMVKKERCASKGDLVIAITSEDDEGSCKCTAWMADYDAFVGGHAAIFRHNLNPVFVSYYFKSSGFQKAKLDYTHGFKVVEISPKDIAKIPIYYPSLSEQQSIVTTLDSIKSKVDQLQANCDRITKECDALKQAILKQVFE